jgi:hypothetical protein
MYVKVKLSCGSSHSQSLFHYIHTRYWNKTIDIFNPSAWSTVPHMLCSHHPLLCSAMRYAQTATCASISHTANELHSLCLSSLLGEGPSFSFVCLLTTSADFLLSKLSTAGVHPPGGGGTAELQPPPHLPMAI